MTAHPFLSESSLEGTVAVAGELVYDRPYEYGCAAEVLVLDPIATRDFSVLEQGLPPVSPARTEPGDRMQYLQVRVGCGCPGSGAVAPSANSVFPQVPPLRRFSHDETDLWTSSQVAAYSQEYLCALTVMRNKANQPLAEMQVIDQSWELCLVQ